MEEVPVVGVPTQTQQVDRPEEVGVDAVDREPVFLGT